MSKLTYTRVRELFDYDQYSGVLTFAKDMPRRGKAGDVAGWDNNHGYWRVHVDNQEYPAHIVIWLWVTGVFPVGDIDHRDRNRSNNIWTNLREASRSQNSMNQGMKPNNTSGFKGVTSRGNSHLVRFRVNGKVIYAGSYATAEAAAEVYDKEVVKHQGDFAVTNKALGLI